MLSIPQKHLKRIKTSSHITPLEEAVQITIDIQIIYLKAEFDVWHF